jgi:hypothetical protein
MMASIKKSNDERLKILSAMEKVRLLARDGLERRTQKAFDRGVREEWPQRTQKKVGRVEAKDQRLTTNDQRPF